MESDLLFLGVGGLVIVSAWMPLFLKSIPGVARDGAVATGFACGLLGMLVDFVSIGGSLPRAGPALRRNCRPGGTIGQGFHSMSPRSWSGPGGAIGGT